MSWKLINLVNENFLKRPPEIYTPISERCMYSRLVNRGLFLSFE